MGESYRSVAGERERRRYRLLFRWMSTKTSSTMEAMRHRKLIATASALFLLALPVSGDQHSVGGIVFPDHSNCSKPIQDIDYYEVDCPMNDPFLSIKLAPGRSVELQCLPDKAKPSDYSWLPAISLGQGESVDFFRFKRCPLPTTPLIETINRLGVTKLHTLLFQTSEKIALTKNHLRGLQGISRLLLSEIGLTDLPEDLFEDMTNLTWLNLRSNKVHLTPNLFASLPNLKRLELGHNGLPSIPEGLFRHLGALTHLNLWQNSLRTLQSDVFKGLDKLEELDLSSNELETLPSDVFHFVPNLKFLNLFSNNLSSLPGDLFVENQQLEVVKLFDNKQAIKELPDYLMSNLTQLKELYLYRCHLQRLPETLFWESFQILNISLNWNDISNIPNRLFRDQGNLLSLDLSNNKITSLSDGVFASLKKLEILNMDNNQLEFISGELFTSMRALKELSMVHNNLRKVAKTAFSFTKSLEIINFAQNNLSFLEGNIILEDNYEFLESNNGYVLTSPFNSVTNLQILNLSRNAISNMFDDWRVSSIHLKVLDLRYNLFKKISFNDINLTANKVKVDLRNNNITEIDFELASPLAASQKIQQPDALHVHSQPAHNVKVLIDGNPISCDCRLFHFILYLKDMLHPQVRSLVTVDPGNVKCISPDDMVGNLVSTIEPQDLLCPLDNNESQSPERCPEGCDCFVRLYDRALIVNCTKTIFDEIPALPDSAKIGMNHTEIHLDNSKLTDLPIGRSPAYDGITVLVLNNNNLASIGVDNLPPNIQYLDLRNNKIEYINNSVTDFLDNSTTLKQMWISGNPFVCDCRNLPFLSFVQAHYSKIVDFTAVTCSDGTQISTLSIGGLCGTPPAIIAVSVIVALAGLIIGIAAALYYKYQQEIKVWLFAKGWCLWWVTEEELDKDKLYDAFISFSHKDEEFVINKLVTTLEGGTHPFKICLHFRDWVAGEFIPSQIARSVEDSRRTIIILSPNFLESVWGRMEFRAAHSRALKEGRARVIVILYGEIGPEENLDAELQAYLSMNTYVKWGDPWFWDKLRYALPHPLHRKHHVISNGVANKKGFDDRLELIHPTTPITPPAQNTPPAHQAHTNPLMNHVDSVPNGNGKVTSLTNNGTITMNGLKVNGNAKHSDV